MDCTGVSTGQYSCSETFTHVHIFRELGAGTQLANLTSKEANLAAQLQTIIKTVQRSGGKFETG